MTRLGGIALLCIACGSYESETAPGDDMAATGGVSGSEATGGAAGSGVPTGGVGPEGGTAGVEQGGAGGVATGGVPPTGGAFPSGGASGGTAPTGGSGQNMCPQIRSCNGQPSCSAALGSSCGTCQTGTFSCGDRQGFYASNGSEWPCDGSDCSSAIQAQVVFCSSPTCTGSGGSSSTGGSGGTPSTDPCASMGRVLWSQRSQGVFNAGAAPAPATVSHSLRVWFMTPAGFCDELYASDGADAARVTLMNGQTGTFAVAIDNLCHEARFPTGTAVINPGGNEFAAPKFQGAVSGACLRVTRNQITASGSYLNGEIDVTWELRGP